MKVVVGVEGSKSEGATRKSPKFSHGPKSMPKTGPKSVLKQGQNPAATGPIIGPRAGPNRAPAGLARGPGGSAHVQPADRPIKVVEGVF